jgi:hypothetical protein
MVMPVSVISDITDGIGQQAKIWPGAAVQLVDLGTQYIQ